MMTITIATDITATLTNRKADEWFKALAVSEYVRNAIVGEDFGWEDFEDLWAEEWEAWEKFFS